MKTIFTKSTDKIEVQDSNGTVTITPNDIQEKLVSGENIKTINSQSILGSGNIVISGGGGGGSIDSIVMNGNPVPVDASGAANLGTVITQHQDISGKANIADLSAVATSGSYNDLTNKPTIPTVPTNVSAFTNDAGYGKITGITMNDVSKGTTGTVALGTVVTSVTMNGSAVTVANGVANLGTVITDVSDKANWGNTLEDYDIGNAYTKSEVDGIESGIREDMEDYLSHKYDKQINVDINFDGVYQKKEGIVYPVAHPDLSTQPSILPQRFGNQKIKEVLIANGRESDIPKGVTVICAWSFTSTQCVPAACEYNGSNWIISNYKSITPQYTLIQYVVAEDPGYDFPKNKIRYWANSKISETTTEGGDGLHKNAFNTSINYHTFSNGVGTIAFNADVTSIGNFAFKGSTFYAIQLPSSVVTIGTSAFQSCGSLSGIEIPQGVTTIGDNAFYMCGQFGTVIMPNTITSIGSEAFFMCNNLNHVTIKSLMPPTLGGSAFNGNRNDRKIYVPSVSLNAYKTATNWSTYASAIEEL